MNKRTWFVLSIAFVLGLAPSVTAQPPEQKYDPGTFRWLIKTSVPDSTNLNPKKNVSLEDLLRFPHAPGVTRGTRDYLDTRIPHFANNLGLNEGDIISTTGWLHLVATEANDGDYHIQISTRKDSAEPCLIVEVPIPHQKFVKDEALYPGMKRTRELIHGLVKAYSAEPTLKGSVMTSPPYVRITGQLFMDYWHVGEQRGKKTCKTAQAWEIHPIIDMRFEPVP